MINRRIRSINFLRSTWIPAIKKLGLLVPQKGGPRPDSKVKAAGAIKGGAKGAKPGIMTYSEIWSDVKGGKTLSSRVVSIMTKGLQLAINKEIASMKQYVEKKLEQNADKFSRAN